MEGYISGKIDDGTIRYYLVHLMKNNKKILIRPGRIESSMSDCWWERSFTFYPDDTPGKYILHIPDVLKSNKKYILCRTTRQIPQAIELLRVANQDMLDGYEIDDKRMSEKGVGLGSDKTLQDIIDYSKQINKENALRSLEALKSITPESIETCDYAINIIIAMDEIKAEINQLIADRKKINCHANCFDLEYALRVIDKHTVEENVQERKGIEC